jgi:hypothetical protein
MSRNLHFTKMPGGKSTDLILKFVEMIKIHLKSECTFRRNVSLYALTLKMVLYRWDLLCKLLKKPKLIKTA